MGKTLVVFESEHGTAERVARAIGRIVCNAKTVAVQDAPDDLSPYDALITVFCFNGRNTANRTQAFLRARAAELRGTMLFWGAAGVGLATRGMDEWVAGLEQAAGRACDHASFVPGEMRVARLTAAERQSLTAFYEQVGGELGDKGELDMGAAAQTGEALAHLIDAVRDGADASAVLPEAELREALRAFIGARNTCVLATAAEGFVRATPLEYEYLGGLFYIVTEGGLKFVGLSQEDGVSLAINDGYSGMGKLASLQVTGTARVLGPQDDGYAIPLEAKSIPLDRISRLPIDMHVLEITPSRFELLDSSLKDSGHAVHQRLDL